MIPGGGVKGACEFNADKESDDRVDSLICDGNGSETNIKYMHIIIYPTSVDMNSGSFFEY